MATRKKPTPFPTNLTVARTAVTARLTARVASGDRVECAAWGGLNGTIDTYHFQIIDTSLQRTCGYARVVMNGDVSHSICEVDCVHVRWVV